MLLCLHKLSLSIYTVNGPELKTKKKKKKKEEEEENEEAVPHCLCLTESPKKERDG